LALRREERNGALSTSNQRGVLHSDYVPCPPPESSGNAARLVCLFGYGLLWYSPIILHLVIIAARDQTKQLPCDATQPTHDSASLPLQRNCPPCFPLRALSCDGGHNTMAWRDTVYVRVEEARARQEWVEGIRPHILLKAVMCTEQSGEEHCQTSLPPNASTLSPGAKHVSLRRTVFYAMMVISQWLKRVTNLHL
jgi:hypothetical protein